MANKTNKTEEAKKLSPKEIKEMRAKTEAWYDEQIPFLEKQFNYEDLVAKIEEAKLRKLHAIMQMAHLMNPYEEGEEEEPSAKEEKRTLKTD